MNPDSFADLIMDLPEDLRHRVGAVVLAAGELFNREEPDPRVKLLAYGALFMSKATSLADTAKARGCPPADLIPFEGVPALLEAICAAALAIRPAAKEQS